MKYYNGNKYEGNWKDDMFYGSGKLTYKNGSSYDGNWVNNEKNGQGI